MIKKGTKIVVGVVPKSITKLPSGKLLVVYASSSGTDTSSSEDVSEEYDTVLEAIGRTPDLKDLNLSALGDVLKMDESSGN